MTREEFIELYEIKYDLGDGLSIVFDEGYFFLSIERDHSFYRFKIEGEAFSNLIDYGKKFYHEEDNIEQEKIK